MAGEPITVTIGMDCRGIHKETVLSYVRTVGTAPLTNFDLAQLSADVMTWVLPALASLTHTTTTFNSMTVRVPNNPLIWDDATISMAGAFSDPSPYVPRFVAYWRTSYNGPNWRRGKKYFRGVSELMFVTNTYASTLSSEVSVLSDRLNLALETDAGFWSPAIHKYSQVNPSQYVASIAVGGWEPHPTQTLRQHD